MPLKRILVMGMSENRGGMETCIMNYYRLIDRDKLQFDFITYNKPPYCAEEIRQLGGRYFVVTGRSVNYKKNKRELRSFFETHGKEYAGLWYNCCLLTDITMFKLAKKSGIPVRILHAHNSQAMGNIITNRLHGIYKKCIHRYATDFWACSTTAGQFFYSDKIRKANRYRIIGNAIDLDRFRFRADIREATRKEFGVSKSFVVGHVARMNPEKNQKFLLEIFYEISKIIPDSVLLFAGQGKCFPILKERAVELGVAEKVKFLGERQDVCNLYMAMDVFLLPSLFEGLPVTLIEAQAAGLVSFTSREAVPREAKITSLLHFLSLNTPAQKWAESICKTHETVYDRKAAALDIDREKWEIKQAAALLEEFF